MIRFYLVMLLYTACILYIGYAKGKQKGSRNSLNRLFAVLTVFDSAEIVTRIKNVLLSAERMSTDELKSKVNDYQKRQQLK